MTLTDPAPAAPLEAPCDTHDAAGDVTAKADLDATRAATFRSIVARLSKQSVDKHFDAYADIDWDDPAMAVDPTDSRFLLWDGDPLGATAWYQAQPPEVQATVALYRAASAMRTGWEFENILQRGLLSLAFWLPNGSPEYRYLHHEVIEESQHSLMFQEFVNRCGLPVKGMPSVVKKIGERRVLGYARRFPELFFLFVLGGEDPVDHLQRQQLRRGGTHPLVERIMRIHVTEEARHVSYARNYLKTAVPQLGPARRHLLSLLAPNLYGVMTRMMIDPPRSLGRVGVPMDVIAESRRTPERAALLVAAAAKPRKLCEELGLMNPIARQLWKRWGLVPDEATGADSDTADAPEAA